MHASRAVILATGLVSIFQFDLSEWADRRSIERCAVDREVRPMTPAISASLE
jgi:hypothetical protein